ncbi:Inactive glucose-6-phosphate 1-dehydrogenase 4 [Citrus sinensis]|nr:Inactive glucose-6-phosphate 1-dehydrogenase 4 [Citrus sinensis]
MDAFLSRTYYFNGGYDSQEGMLKLSSLMEHIEVGLIKSQIIDVYKYLAHLPPGGSEANMIFYQSLTNALLSKFQEEQLYKIDNLLGRNLIENITVLRHSAQSYTPNHSIACNGAPINLNGEDIRNKKVKVLRSICRLEPCNVILGHYKDTSGYKVDVKLNNLTPTYFAVALYIGNARWDGVPFVIKASMGLIKHRYNVEVPDSYEHLLLDVIDGDNHLFMRSDELTAGWNILNPLLQEID